MSDCIFCRIIAGELPANVVYEDDEVMAFRDVNPVAPVHILVVPRHHVPSTNDFQDADAALAGRLILAARTIAREQGFADEGYRMNINCGQGAGQTVFHVHLHLLAGRPFTWPPG